MPPLDLKAPEHYAPKCTVIPCSPAGITWHLIPPGSQRGACSYSLARREANKKLEIPARLGFQPIDAQNISLPAASLLSEKGAKPPWSCQ